MAAQTSATYPDASIVSSNQTLKAVMHEEKLTQGKQKTTKLKGKDTPMGDGSRDQEGINLCVQILLAACSMGVEMCATFIQIFAVLFLQFLGVPTALVSMNGVICGATSLVILPLIGWFSDRGSNPVIRKLMTMSVCLTVYLLGLSGIGFCGILKVIFLEGVLHGGLDTDTGENSTVKEVAPPWVKNQNESSISEVINIDKNTTLDLVTMTSDVATSLETSIPYSAYLAILCFASLDIGFDISMALSRAFILECVPTFQHTRLLLIASIIQSSSGLLFAFLSTFDFSYQFATTFNVNGTAATIIFYAIFLGTVVTFGFSCTMITGYSLLKKKQSNHNIRRTVSMNKMGNQAENRDLPTKNNKEKTSQRYQNLWRKKPQRRSMLSDLELVKDSESVTCPLLREDHAYHTNDYLSISVNSTAIHAEEDERFKITKGADENQSSLSLSYYGSHQHPTEETDSLQNATVEDASDIGKNSFEESLKESIQMATENAANRQKYDRGHQWDDAVVAIGAFKASYSMSLSLAHSTLGPEGTYRSLVDAEKPSVVKTTMPKPGTKRNANVKLIILCVSSFLTIGSMICSLQFTSNALTLDVYHGDPTALPGTDGYRQYQKGLATAAWGNFFMYITFTLVSLSNKKIIDLIGEKSQFTISHVIFISCYLALLLVRSEELFYVSITVSGLNRACVFTLPYILANKFTQEEVPGGSDSPSLKRGKVMTLIGFLVPLHYIAISAIMGPLMDATGNVWVPTIYGVVTASVATVIFTSLFFVKN